MDMIPVDIEMIILVLFILVSYFMIYSIQKNMKDLLLTVDRKHAARLKELTLDMDTLRKEMDGVLEEVGTSSARVSDLSDQMYKISEQMDGMPRRSSRRSTSAVEPEQSVEPDQVAQPEQAEDSDQASKSMQIAESEQIEESEQVAGREQAADSDKGTQPESLSHADRTFHPEHMPVASPAVKTRPAAEVVNPSYAEPPAERVIPVAPPTLTKNDTSLWMRQIPEPPLSFVSNSSEGSDSGAGTLSNEQEPSIEKSVEDDSGERQPSEHAVTDAPERQPSEQAATDAPERQPSEQTTKDAPESQPSEQTTKEAGERQPSEQAVTDAPERQPSEQAATDAPERQPAKHAAKDTPSKTYYFRAPGMDGAFHFDSAMLSPGSDYLYKIVSTNGDRLGYLTLNPEANFKQLIIQKETMLTPACNLYKVARSHHNRVSMLRPGRVIRKKGRWVITSKITVELS